MLLSRTVSCENFSHCVNTDRRRTGSLRREPLCVSSSRNVSHRLSLFTCTFLCFAFRSALPRYSPSFPSLRLIFFFSYLHGAIYRVSISLDPGSYIKRLTRDLLRNSLANEIKFLPAVRLAPRGSSSRSLCVVLSSASSMSRFVPLSLSLLLQHAKAGRKK